MFRALPPVGEPIHVKQDCLHSKVLQGIFPGWDAHYYGSGAMALASVLQSVLGPKGSYSREVLLPAYSCPELISAILYSGGVPILVDLEKDRPWLSLEDLARKITPNTAAIIAVDLFGIPERIRQIRNIIRDHNIILIEDSAQYMPNNPGADSWSGDFIILSFGRGKPVSLLGGGVVLSRKGEMLAKPAILPEKLKPASFSQQIRARLKCHIYNALINPYLYWIPASLPFLHIGDTRFKPLLSIDPMDPGNLCLLSSNLERHSRLFSNKAEEINKLLKSIVRKDIIDLAGEIQPNLHNLLRYPVLIRNSEKRKEFLTRSEKLGLGVTALYGTNLTGVAGMVQEVRRQVGLPNSSAFAAELITLPIHSGVSLRDIKLLARLLRSL